MGLLDLFRKPKTIQDDFFGTLKFISFRDEKKNYFEGKRKFEPTGNIIAYFIRAELIGPTDEQRAFYIKIQESYTDLLSKATPLIEKELVDWKGNFNREFKLVAITIPRLQSRPIIWEMSFESIHDNNYQITVGFKNFEPDSSAIDV